MSVNIGADYEFILRDKSTGMVMEMPCVAVSLHQNAAHERIGFVDGREMLVREPMRAEIHMEVVGDITRRLDEGLSSNVWLCGYCGGENEYRGKARSYLPEREITNCEHCGALRD